mmetsp:Transcript_619/g.1114  ORF Transcript_619/g.1114 Transcript_619/m.1114 type:complete len:183 (-) Transcript_619:1546-2094(-)
MFAEFNKELRFDSKSGYLRDDVVRYAENKEYVILLTGEVIHGFGRGSKLLGCPTANIPPEPYLKLLEVLSTGIYFGFCTVLHNNLIDQSQVHLMVMSIGWNPFFDNKHKTIEAHILDFPDIDFYGAELRLCVVGYIRPELSFESLDELKAAIAQDIVVARECLAREDLKLCCVNEFLLENKN